MSPGDRREYQYRDCKGASGGRWISGQHGRTPVLVSIALTDLLAAIDTTGVSVAMPQIARHLHVPPSAAQWVVNGFGLAMVSLLIVAGKVGDRYGHRKLYLWGLVIFGLGSLGCGVSTSLSQLTLLRFIQGVGGAILYTCGWALIARLWEDRERAFAVTAAFFAIGFIAGPPIAGWLAGTAVGGFAGWHLIFLINIPVVVAALVIAHRFTPHVDTDPSARANILSVALLMVGLMLLVQALSHPDQLAAWAVAAASGLALALSEQRGRDKLLDTGLFRNRTFVSANMATMLLMLAVSGFSFASMFFMQYALGYSSLSAGVRMLPVPVFMAAFAGVGSQIRQWRRGAIATGLLSVAALGWLLINGGRGSYWTGLFPAFLLLGAGGGLLMTSVVSAVMGSAPQAKAGTASGLLSTLQQIGALVGVAAVSGIVSNFPLAIGVLLVAALGALAAGFMIEPRPRLPGGPVLGSDAVEAASDAPIASGS